MNWKLLLVVCCILVINSNAWKRRRSSRRRRVWKKVGKVAGHVVRIAKYFGDSRLKKLCELKDKDQGAYNREMLKIESDLKEEYGEDNAQKMLDEMDELISEKTLNPDQELIQHHDEEEEPIDGEI
uniref:Uncharacterized LOC100181827 n=1 Tax=Ciona intestinalis TaxID=7719 RepID=H2XRQ1_CIOIN|nr:uncharacterized protein LOC100181827 [Ciona intestinalis]|eukprot:XP_002125249.1 uncharacterized protein LOC100181827 [Ciona intestinalis]